MPINKIYEKLEEIQDKQNRNSEFSPFRFIRQDEDGLSAIIAFLLNPKENHNQGDLFLTEFISMLGNKIDYQSGDNIRVTLHHQTYKGRYHDIFIQCEDKWVMSIESKLNFASEQYEQIYHYIDDMDKYVDRNEAKDRFMIFLNVSGDEPYSGGDKWANLSEHHKKVITPEFLHQWLEKTNVVNSEIQSFINYFKEFIFNAYLKDEVDTPLTVLYNEDLHTLQDELIYILRERLDNYEGWEVDERCSFSSSNALLRIKRTFLDKDEYKHELIVCCYTNDAKGGYWGILNDGFHTHKFPEIVQRIEELCKEFGGKNNQWWLFYRYCSQDYLANWTELSWLQLRDGKMVDDLINNIRFILEDEKLNTLLKS